MIKIKPNEIHLWFCQNESINNTRTIRQYQNVLSQDERIKQVQFYFEEHRHQYLVTRALLRTTLSLYSDSYVKPEDWIFQVNPYGKPYIESPPLSYTPFFNLSHTKGMIVLAIAPEPIMGVDIEWATRQGNIVQLAEHCFSPSEIADLLKLPYSEQINRFYELWTLKEAYIKACGMGLSIPLDSFSYHFPMHNRVNISFSESREDQSSLWQFWQLNASPDHKVAIAIKPQNNNRFARLVYRKVIPFENMQLFAIDPYRQSI